MEQRGRRAVSRRVVDSRAKNRQGLFTRTKLAFFVPNGKYSENTCFVRSIQKVETNTNDVRKLLVFNIDSTRIRILPPKN